MKALDAQLLQRDVLRRAQRGQGAEEGLAPALLWVLGAGLLAFAIHARHVSRKDSIARGEAIYFVAADAAYVVASAAVLLGFPGLMSGLGRLFFAAAADVVAVLAIAEDAGLRRMSQPAARVLA